MWVNIPVPWILWAKQHFFASHPCHCVFCGSRFVRVVWLCVTLVTGAILSERCLSLDLNRKMFFFRCHRHRSALEFSAVQCYHLVLLATSQGFCCDVVSRKFTAYLLPIHHINPRPTTTSHQIPPHLITSHRFTSNHITSHHTWGHIKLQTITWHDIAWHDITSHDITSHYLISARNQPHCLTSQHLAPTTLLHLTSQPWHHTTSHRSTSHDHHPHTAEAQPATTKTSPPDGTAEGWCAQKKIGLASALVGDPACIYRQILQIFLWLGNKHIDMYIYIHIIYTHHIYIYTYT